MSNDRPFSDLLSSMIYNIDNRCSVDQLRGTEKGFIVEIQSNAQEAIPGKAQEEADPFPLQVTAWKRSLSVAL